MKKPSRLTAVLYALLAALGFRSLARVVKDGKPSRGKALAVSLLILFIIAALSVFLWALKLI